MEGIIPHQTPMDLHGSANQEESTDWPNITLPPMRIVLVAPHPASKNGIGNYTARLIRELRLQGPQCSIMSPTDLLWGGWELPPHWPDVFLEIIDATHPQLVHIQHGLYLGHGPELTRFLAELRTRHIPCVVTLHGVWSPTLFFRWSPPFYRLLAANVAQVIVHQRDGTLKSLQKHGIPADRIAVIPHGTWTSAETVPANIPDTMDMTGRRLVLFAGNIFQQKGLHIVIQAFKDVVRRIPGACLLVVGNERAENFIDRLYRVYLHAKMHQGLKAGWLISRAEYVPDDELWEHITAAEVVVFPYLRRYGSASGVFHRVLAAGRPAICSNVPTFAEAISAWSENLTDLFPPPGSVKAWSRAIIKILSDESFRQRAMAASASLGRETSWSLVARKHLQLYGSLLSPSPRSGEK